MTKHLILLIAPLLAACATAGASPAQIEGSKWTFTQIDGAAPVSGQTSLAIKSDQIDVFVGCNGMGSNLTIAGEKLIVGPVISTRMYCDGVMEQEHAVGRLLAASPTFKIANGKLVLQGGGHRAVLQRTGD
ncbi:MAG: META domain-containing protein [Novosphingobium sp.]|uniref:META domain-containing protein n=1 Tax=Novosphingobium sp. TaxID=1874826 RepID=UPI003C7D5A0C